MIEKAKFTYSALGKAFETKNNCIWGWIKISSWRRLKILTPKQMLQRLPIALAQLKVGKNSENLLNEIRQIYYSLYLSKKLLKKFKIT